MATNASGHISIFSLLEMFRRRKMMILIPTLLLASGFAFYAYQQPDRYKAQSLVAAEHLRPPDYLKHVAPEPLNIQEHLWTVREVLYSPPLLNDAARELAAYQNVKSPLPSAVLEDFKKRVGVKVESEHTFFISFEGDSPSEVHTVTNKLAALFVQQASAKSDQQITDARNIIDEQVNSLKERLEQQGQQIRSYKQRAVNELPEHMDFNIKEVDSLRAQYEDRVSKVADEEAKKTMLSKQIAELEQQGVLSQPIVTERTPSQIKLDDLRFREKELATRYLQAHPELREVRRQIRELEAAIANEPKKPRTDLSATYVRYSDLKSQLESTNQRLDSYQRELSRLSNSIQSYQRRVEATPQHERALAEMTREYHVNESQFHNMLDKQLDAKLALGIQKSETGIAFSVVEPASMPTTPDSPQRSRLVLMGLFAGLALGLVMVFVMEHNDTTIATVDEFQEFTRMPMLAAIPAVAAGKRAKRGSCVIATTEPDSVAAEQYRVLAMKVHQQCSTNRASVILLTSAAGSEGKSMTAVNLAQSLATIVSGPVLLIDGDMRKPRIHEYLEMQDYDGGLYELLQSADGNYSRHLKRVGNIHVIPGSTPTGNPVAVLSSPKTRAMFERLRNDFAFVIVDAPPILPVADSHILSGLSDKVMFIVRARKTPRELFQHAVESFASEHVMGAVLNDVDYQRSRYAYAYEYYKKSA
jgi:polysaccharide chain length determinant protein (PEP-CTERM system associated)